MLAGLALVALLGLIGLRRRNNEPAQPLAPINMEVARVANESVAFEELGIQVDPSNGWTHLSVSGAMNQMPTFINESQHLIVRIHPFIFESWPPGAEELTERKIDPNISESPDQPGSIAEANVETIHYSEIDVEWIDVERDRSRGNSYRVGRIPLDRGDLLVTAAIHSMEKGMPESIEAFCNSIAPLGK